MLAHEILLKHRAALFLLRVKCCPSCDSRRVGLHTASTNKSSIAFSPLSTISHKHIQYNISEKNFIKSVAISLLNIARFSKFLLACSAKNAIELHVLSKIPPTFFELCLKILNTTIVTAIQ